MTKNLVYVIAPTDFRDEEYFTPKEILENNKVVIVTASKGVKLAKGKLGGKTNVDINISDITPKRFDGIVIAGGPGAYKMFEDIELRRVIKEFNAEQKLVAAICVAPMILAKSGILLGKKATVWDGDLVQSREFEDLGINFTGDSVTLDQNIITANGPQAAQEFGEKIVEYFSS
jgi:protease I